MKRLYRFLSFESFVDIVQTKSLTFVKPHLWEDPYESYILKTLKKPNGFQEILQCISEKEIQGMIDLEFIEMIGSNYHGQCWTMTPESDAFWRIYSFANKAVRIEIDMDSIARMDTNGIKVIHGPVVYEEELSLESELRKIFQQDKINMMNVFLTKRAAFKHENEYRLMTFSIEGANSPTKKISFDNAPEFIKSVMLHPLAPSWFDKTLETFCFNNNLKYNGKSRLYNFE